MWGQLLLKYFDKQLKRGWILKTINFNSFLLKFTIFSFIYYMLRQKWKGGKSMIFHFWYLKLSVCSLPPPHPDATCLWCVPRVFGSLRSHLKRAGWTEKHWLIDTVCSDPNLDSYINRRERNFEWHILWREVPFYHSRNGWRFEWTHPLA